MIEIFLAIFYTALFVFLIWEIPFFRTEGTSPKTLASLFLLKIIFGFIFYAVYAYHTPYQNKADAFLYFEDGKVIYRVLFTNPLDYIKILLGFNDASLNHYLADTGYWTRSFNQGLYNETKTVIRFNALVCIFSFGYYHVHTVFMCFVSFAGLVGIYKTFLPLLASKKKELLTSVFLLPSVLFWGSGVLKEGLILFSSGMLIYHWFKLTDEKTSVTRLLWVLFFAGLLLITKIYMLIILLPALMAHAWVVKSNYRFALLKYIAVLLVYISAGILQPSFDFPFMLMSKQRQSMYLAQGGAYLVNQQTRRHVYIKSEIKERIIHLKNKPGYCKIKPGVPYLNWTHDNYSDTGKVQSSVDTSTYWVYYNQDPAGSRIKIPVLHPTLANILENSPQAFLTSLFRPHLFEIKNPLMLLSAIENCLVISFVILCLFFFSVKARDKHLIFFCTTIVILLFVLVGLTTPILGTAVRYKMPALPFLMIIFVLLFNKEKLLYKFPFLKKIIG